MNWYNKGAKMLLYFYDKFTVYTGMWKWSIPLSIPEENLHCYQKLLKVGSIYVHVYRVYLRTHFVCIESIFVFWQSWANSKSNIVGFVQSRLPGFNQSILRRRNKITFLYSMHKTQTRSQGGLSYSLYIFLKTSYRIIKLLKCIIQPTQRLQKAKYLFLADS